jgi:hypothetical protein
VSTIDRTKLQRLVDELPDEVLSDVALFLEFIRYKVTTESSTTPYVPIPLGGLWQDITITDNDITTVRHEMWRGFGEAVE